MKPSVLVVSLGVCVSGSAFAGGLILPGSGAVSTSRAGTGVASTEGGEAISLNPAGMAKSKGTTITVGAAIINYAMSFQRNGTYDTYTDPNLDPTPYEGQDYPIVENNPKPPLGIGPYQPIPVIAVTTDLGGRVPGLTVGAGLYAPNAYPFRNMNNVNGQPFFVPKSNGGYSFPTNLDAPPPPTRYDIIEQEAAIILPSVAASYRIMPDLDVGARFSIGWSEVKSTVAVWGEPANYNEYIKKDGLFTLDAKDSFVTAWALGAAYRPAPTIELGAQYTGQIDMRAEGEAVNENGPQVTLNMQPIMVLPSIGSRCNAGGTPEKLKGCVEFAVPMTATVGGRYKFLGEGGKLNGDLELNVNWQHWGAERTQDYRVVVDAQVTTASMPDNGIDLKDNIVRHGLKDTYGVLLGGSWNFPAGNNTVTARGGVGYETGAAKKGWERADFDGAARAIFTVGGSYKLPRVSIDLGFGYIYEGTRTDSRTCNPVLTAPPYEGCGPNGEQQPIEDRQGPGPINPIVNADQQLENPVNEGTYKSHYLLFMLGMSTWF
ncbi:MAG TPA: outer membrane protein transport protein [Kofleriaceae bacterium]|nr:outer membrane protein transport protein [Kofleriaceae bacterium]